MTGTSGEALFEVQIGDHQFRPTRLEQFLNWAQREQQNWQWLREVPDEALSNSARHNILQQYDAIVSFAQTLVTNGLSGHNPQASLNTHYSGSPAPLIHSTSETGQAIMAIREAFGPNLAATAYGISVAQIVPNWWNSNHVRAAFLVANPSAIAKDKIRAATRADYARWKNEAETLLAKHDALLVEKEAMVEKLRGRADRLVVSTFWRTARRNIQLRGKVRSDADAAILDINNVKKAYSEDMKLRASVQYWDEKKGTHEKNRNKAFWHLVYFAAFGVLLGMALFGVAISFMLEASGVDVFAFMTIEPSKGKNIALSTYVVVTAALGTALTALFWTARILVRHYLTERRLEGDAAERRVMTQTYLALLNEGAVKEEDRLVILNTLFRPSPDNPNSDDSAGDVALPALLAKLMDQRIPTRP